MILEEYFCFYQYNWSPRASVQLNVQIQRVQRLESSKHYSWTTRRMPFYEISFKVQFDGFFINFTYYSINIIF